MIGKRLGLAAVLGCLATVTACSRVEGDRRPDGEGQDQVGSTDARATDAPSPADAARTEVEAFEAWLETFMSTGEIPGAQVAFFNASETFTLSALGVRARGGDPMTDQTKLRIASVSKLFTQVAAAQLVEAGKLSWNDPVRKHLRWFNPRPVDGGKDGAVITVRELLNHTSGLQRDVGEAFPMWSYGTFPTVEQLKAAAPGWKVYPLPPDDRLKYSNLGVSLVGEVVATVSGMPFPEYVLTHVAAPLGLTDTKFDVTEEEMAVHYMPKEISSEPRPEAPFIASTGGMAGATGVASTAADLARLGRFMMNAKSEHPVLSGAALQEFQALAAVTARDLGWGVGAGGPLWLKLDNGTVLGHTGSFLGSRTALVWTSDRRAGLAVIFNAGADVNTGAVIAKAMPALIAVGKTAEPEPLPPPAPPADPRWQDFIGRYVFRPRGVVAVATDAKGNLTLSGRRLVPVPGAFNRFLDPYEGFSGNPQEALIFFRDEAGKVRLTQESGGHLTPPKGETFDGRPLN